MIRGSALRSTPSVVRIDSDFDGMELVLYLVRGDRWALIDSGIATTPRRHVLPALESLGASLGHIDLVVHTHAHVDHIGGDAELLAANPALRTATHRLGAPFVECHRRYFAQAYTASFPGEWQPPGGLEERILRLCGENCLVDEVFGHGDRIDLGGRALEVISVPAHSADHVILRDLSSGIVFSGDALQARGLKRADGSWLFPLYTDVDLYRNSLSTIERLAAPVLCTAHEGMLNPEGQAALLQECRGFADELDSFLLQLTARSPVALAEAVRAVANTWTYYDGGLQMHTTIAAHLDGLARSGRLTRTLAADGTKRWRAGARDRTQPAEEEV
jgi:glyoxylase-like metal-dependent hydrolase (beta-lactamase superfamily II)